MNQRSWSLPSSGSIHEHCGAYIPLSTFWGGALYTGTLLVSDPALECRLSASAVVTDLTILHWPFDLTPTTPSIAWVTFYLYLTFQWEFFT